MANSGLDDKHIRGGIFCRRCLRWLPKNAGEITMTQYVVDGVPIQMDFMICITCRSMSDHNYWYHKRAEARAKLLSDKKMKTLEESLLDRRVEDVVYKSREIKEEKIADTEPAPQIFGGGPTVDPWKQEDVN